MISADTGIVDRIPTLDFAYHVRPNMAKTGKKAEDGLFYIY